MPVRQRVFIITGNGQLKTATISELKRPSLPFSQIDGAMVLFTLFQLSNLVTMKRYCPTGSAEASLAGGAVELAMMNKEVYRCSTQGS